MKAQELLDEVTEELERKHNPEQQLCALILKKNPKLKKYVKNNSSK